MTTRLKSTWLRFFRSPVRRLGLLALVLAVALGVLGYRNIEDFLANASTELASIAITVLIIDFLNERRAEHQLKLQLIREMGSTDNAIALRAVKELRAHGWHEDGSLQGVALEKANLKGAELNKADLRGAILELARLSRADLDGANLQDANIRAADLQGASLVGANLQRAYLVRANLPEANLLIADMQMACLTRANLKDVKGLDYERLAQVDSLQGATLPDGSLYDGRFNLKGDIDSAQKLHIDTAHPEAMAEFYSISLDAYLHGQDTQARLTTH